MLKKSVEIFRRKLGRKKKSWLLLKRIIATKNPSRARSVRTMKKNGNARQSVKHKQWNRE